MRASLPKIAARVGVLLLNSQFRPVHYNAEAATILNFARPQRPHETPSLDGVLPGRRLPRTNGHVQTPPVPATVEFTSGRRRYLGRLFQLDPNTEAENRQKATVVLLLEREVRAPVEAVRWSEEFQLTSRESQTVRLLLKGLTSKEIAAQMNISPNTVKSFLKLAMAKVGASNRTGLVARIFERAALGIVIAMPLGLLSPLLF